MSQDYLSAARQNMCSGFLTRSNTEQDVQPQKMARSLKFQTYNVDGVFYLCRENKGADQLRIFRIWFSHDTAQITYEGHLESS